MGELRRGAEGEVHVLPQHLRDVGLGDLHAPRELRLVDAHPLHPQENPAKKRRTDMVNRSHLEKSFAPVAYAAEYATSRELAKQALISM